MKESKVDEKINEALTYIGNQPWYRNVPEHIVKMVKGILEPLYRQKIHAEILEKAYKVAYPDTDDKACVISIAELKEILEDK